MEVRARLVVAGAVRHVAAVAVKTQAAYSRNIDFEDVSPEEVEDVFRRALGREPVAPADEKRLQDHLFWYCVNRATEHALPVKVRLYDRLFSVADPAGEKQRDYRELLNPDSLEQLEGALVEPGLATAEPGDACQFERLGYFNIDVVDTATGGLVFNRVVTLRDTWAKVAGH